MLTQQYIRTLLRHPAYRNTWLACTATVLIYFWFN